eukprot:3884264-Prymnesium_polylepis.1
MNTFFDCAQIAPGNFRLLFVHTADGLGPASVIARDNIPITTVSPGHSAYLDHHLIAPHAA